MELRARVAWTLGLALPTLISLLKKVLYLFLEKIIKYSYWIPIGPELINNDKDPYTTDYNHVETCLEYLEKYGIYDSIQNYLGTYSLEFLDSDQPFFLHCGTLIPHPGYPILIFIYL